MYRLRVRTLFHLVFHLLLIKYNKFITSTILSQNQQLKFKIWDVNKPFGTDGKVVSSNLVPSGFFLIQYNRHGQTEARGMRPSKDFLRPLQQILMMYYQVGHIF